MAVAQAFHPSLLSDSAMFIDDDCCFSSPTVYIPDPVVPTVDVTRASAKLSRLKTVRARRSGRTAVIGQAYNLVLHIEPAIPELEREYSEFLKSHIVNLQSQPSTIACGHYWYCGSVDSYRPPIEPLPVAQIDCDGYYQPLIERVRGFENTEYDDDSVPASVEVVGEVIRFIEHIPTTVRRPGAALGADGSIALVWQDRENYITAVFYGTGLYSYVVRMRKRTVSAASSKVDTIPAELSNLVSQLFHRV